MGNVTAIFVLLAVMLKYLDVDVYPSDVALSIFVNASCSSPPSLASRLDIYSHVSP
jgi:hypothetical protein